MKEMKLAPLGLMLTFSTFLSACGQMISPEQHGQMINMPFGGLMMLILLVAIVVFTSLVIKGVTRKDTSDDSPLTILKRRYAKGEIDKEEFERLKKEITDD